MSNNDLPLQLHFALFKNSDGFVLKPPEMLQPPNGVKSDGRMLDENEAADGSTIPYWPAPRKTLTSATIEFISIHNCPKRTERRPKFNGRRGMCHAYVPELSGTSGPPNSKEQSTLTITLSVSPIGGFCGVGTQQLPLQTSADTEVSITPVTQGNGLNCTFPGQSVYCLSAEPHATFVRVAVSDSAGQQVAYETFVLGRAQHGYRVLQQRGMLGTRIHLCYVLVHISCDSSEPNLWLSARQVSAAYVPGACHLCPPNKLPDATHHSPSAASHSCACSCVCFTKWREVPLKTAVDKAVHCGKP
eukprot:375248-Prymnesium_polylepis.2